MTEKKKNLVFSIPIEAALELADEAEMHMAMSSEFILELLDTNDINEFKISLLCDYYSSNYKLKSQFKVFFSELEKEDKEVLLPEQEMVILESILLARFYMAKDLQEISNLSFAVH